MGKKAQTHRPNTFRLRVANLAINYGGDAPPSTQTLRDIIWRNIRADVFYVICYWKWHAADLSIAYAFVEVANREQGEPLIDTIGRIIRQNLCN